MSSTSGTGVGAPPRVLTLGSFALSVIGLGPAGYLTYEHFTGSKTLACSESGTVNCLKVTTSTYSRFLGIPVAVLGLAFFVAMVVLCAPKAWSLSSTTLPWLGGVRLAAGAVGVISVIYLVWAELFQIDAICLWCTGVHVITVLLFGVLLFAAAAGPSIDDDLA